MNVSDILALRRTEPMSRYTMVVVVFLFALGSVVTVLSSDGDASPHGSPVRLDFRKIVPASVPESHAFDTLIYQHRPIGLSGLPTVVTVSRSEPLQMQGWSVDRRAGRPSLAVYVDIGGTTYADRTGFARDDVANALAMSGAQRAGFLLDIPANVLPVGDVLLAFRAVSADGTQSYALDPALHLNVTR